MALPTEVINRMFGLCVTCGADPCKCPNTNAAIRSPSLSSMVGAQYPSGGSIPNHLTISSGSISGSSISAVSVDDLVSRRVDVTTNSEPKPEPKSFVPSWEKEEEPEEEEPVFKIKPQVNVTVESPDLIDAINLLRKALADEVHKAVMDNNTLKAQNLAGMTSAELFDHFT